MRYLFLLLVLCSISPAMCDETTTRHICEQKQCRGKGVIKIRIDQTQYLEIDLAGTVIAHESNISIYPGETYSISARIKNGQIVDLTPVKGMPDRAKHLRVSFVQQASQDGELSSLLQVFNPFEYPLRYEAYIDFDGSNNFVYTSSCPVKPGLTTYEHWPRAIVHLVMTNVRLLRDHAPGSGPIACE